jgi:hypothetical protein
MDRVLASGADGSEIMQWEYFDRMVIFSDEEGGLVSGLDAWINGVGAEGWELASSVPLIAPNKDGIAYGTIGLHLIFKRRLLTLQGA